MTYTRNIDNPDEFLKNFTGWYAPSMILTNYFRHGFVRLEVTAYEYENGKMIGRSGFCDDFISYPSAKNAFWQFWNSEHKGHKLHIGRFEKDSGY